MPRKTFAAADVRPGPTRFNEAAARCRGKLGVRLYSLRHSVGIASMRPRPDAAENAV